MKPARYTWLALAASLLIRPLAAQDLAVPDFEVVLDTGGEEWVPGDAEIELTMSRALATGEGRLAVLIGPEDRTDLFRRTERGLAYRAAELRLPEGENEIAVYLVDGAARWEEVARLPLQVLSPRGYTRHGVEPAIDLNAHGLVDGDQEDLDDSDQAGDLQVGLRTVLGRQAWDLTAELSVVGSSQQMKALRFAVEGEEAPRVDLASYQLRLSGERGEIELGHTTYGESRHLIDGFSSRGLRGRYQLGRRATISFAALNGSEVVGWDNVLGLSSSAHRMAAANLGIELLPQRPGGLTVDLSYLDGSVQSADDFNQGSVNDAEQSDGWSARVVASSPGGRVRAEGSVTRSSFRNPEDPFLAQGTDLVGVEEEERDARYLQVAFDLLRDRPLGNRTLAMSLALTHDRVDPLFRSVAAFTRSDLEENSANLDLTYGPLTAQLQHTRSEDNLDDIPSILKTRTRLTAFNLLVPFGQLSARGTVAWPTLSYGYHRLRQFGVGLPEGGGFSPGHVPDQTNGTHTAGLEWQGDGWQSGYRFTGTRQDNRQPGRELADFRTTVHTVFSSHTVTPSLELSGELTSELFESLAIGRRESTERLGLSWSWRPQRRSTGGRRSPVTRWSWTGSLAYTTQETGTEGVSIESVSTSLVVDSEWAYRFLDRTRRSHGATGQVYLRVSNEESDLEDRLFGIFENRRVNSVISGINLSFH